MNEKQANEVCGTLARFELWRRGEDCRTYREIGVFASEISAALDEAVAYIAETFGVTELPTWNCRTCRHCRGVSCALGIIGRCEKYEGAKK